MNTAFWSGKRVLVTGHTGFKGGWLGFWLRHLGADVHGFSLAPPTTPSFFEVMGMGRHVNDQRGDVRDLTRVQAAVTSAAPDVVFHLAAQPLVRQSYADPVETYATNVMGTVHVLEAIRKTTTVRAAVIITTDKCYENKEWLWGYRENDRLGGRDPYSNSKACAELVTSAYIRSFFGDGNVAVATARAGNVIGGGDWAADRLLPDLVAGFNDRRTVRLRNPNATRPWQHVLDPLAGYLQLAERLWDSAGSLVDGDGWNFGPSEGDARSVSFIADRAAALWGSPATWETDGGSHPHEAGLLGLDCAKAHTLLRWKPRLDLESALSWAVDWYRCYYSRGDIQGLTLGQLDRYVALQPGG